MLASSQLALSADQIRILAPTWLGFAPVQAEDAAEGQSGRLCAHIRDAIADMTIVRHGRTSSVIESLETPKRRKAGGAPVPSIDINIFSDPFFQ